MTEMPADDAPTNISRRIAIRRFPQWAADNWDRLPPFGQWLAFTCASRGRTPRQLAADAGLRPQAVDDLVKLGRSPRPDTRSVLALHLGVTEEFIVELAGEPRWPRTVPTEIADYKSLIQTLCYRLKTSRHGLERRLGWVHSRLIMELLKGLVPYPEGIADLGELIVTDVPEIIPDGDDVDVGEWLAKVTGLKSSQNERVERGHRMQRKIGDKVSRWSHQRLEQELHQRFNGRVPTPLKQELRDVPYGRPVGAAGVRLYRSSFAWRDPPLHLIRKPRTYAPRTAKGRARKELAANLRSLERGKGYLFQCQSCGELCRRIGKLRAKHNSEHAGKVCRTCWNRYLKHSGYMAWMRGGSEGAPPPLQKRRGPLIGPEEIRHRGSLVLRHQLGKLDDQFLADNVLTDHRDVMRDTERRLRESGDSWCRKLSAALVKARER